MRASSSFRRRILAIMASGLLAASLSACGTPQTYQVYQAGEGADEYAENVSVLAGVIVAAENGEGTFLATLVNKNLESFDELTDIVGEGLEVGESGVPIPPEGLVNLADENPIAVTGNFELGQNVPLTMTFASGDIVEITVPVVTQAGPYEDISVPGDEAAKKAAKKLKKAKKKAKKAEDELADAEAEIAEETGE